MPRAYSTHTTTDELVADYAPLIKDKVILTTGVSRLPWCLFRPIHCQGQACVARSGRSQCRQAGRDGSGNYPGPA